MQHSKLSRLKSLIWDMELIQTVKESNIHTIFEHKINTKLQTIQRGYIGINIQNEFWV